MVVEDEPTIAMLLSEVLQSMGHVVCAVEAREAGAVAAAARCKPDLMLVDARLKHGSGLLAVERILRTGFVPHVFVSGDRLEDRGLGAGAVILQKPYREADLKQAMQRAMLAAVA